MLGSDADLILELGNFLCTLHDRLLDGRLVALKLKNLSLHVIVLLLLFQDACLQVFEVRHDIWINHFNILVILSGQMIFHQTNLLPQHLYLLLVFSECYLCVADPFLDPLDLSFDTLITWDSNFSTIGTKCLIIASWGDTTTLD